IYLKARQRVVLWNTRHANHVPCTSLTIPQVLRWKDQRFFRQKWKTRPSKDPDLSPEAGRTSFHPQHQRPMPWQILRVRLYSSLFASVLRRWLARLVADSGHSSEWPHLEHAERVFWRTPLFRGSCDASYSPDQGIRVGPST